MSQEKRPYQSEQDRKLVDQTRAIIDRSRQLLLESKAVLNRNMGRRHNTVSIAGETAGPWRVFVEESAHPFLTRSFEIEHHAIDYAERQRTRLGLRKVARI